MTAEVVPRRRTGYELVAAARSRYDSVECPSAMPACAPDPLSCVFCGHPWDVHSGKGCGAWRIFEGRCFCPRTEPGKDPVYTLTLEERLALEELVRLPPLPTIPLPPLPSVDEFLFPFQRRS